VDRAGPETAMGRGVNAMIVVQYRVAKTLLRGIQASALAEREHQMTPRRYCRWSRKGRGSRYEASEKQEFLDRGNTDRGVLISTCRLVLFSNKLVII
jgi:hypothetical protein